LLHWQTLVRSTPIGLLLDLDGTLIPFAPSLDQARPDQELLDLFADLSATSGVTVAIVSGRPREVLDHDFAHLTEVLLVAEHGGWRRRHGAWQPAFELDVSALQGLAVGLGALVRTYPGARLERKTWSLALHYRSVSLADRAVLFVEAAAALGQWLGQHPGFERMQGAEVIEVRPVRLRKSLAVDWVRELTGPSGRLIALGDDVTDEDTFNALGPNDEAIRIDPQPGRPSAAAWELPSSREARDFLRWLWRSRQSSAADQGVVLPAPARRSGRRRYEVEGGSGRITATPLRKERLLVVSNRLPELRSSSPANGDNRKRNVGGLVSALQPALSRREGLWLGWSGRIAPVQPEGQALQLSYGVDDTAEPALAWVDLPEKAYEAYYNGYCNRALWPLLHSFPERLRLQSGAYQAYLEVSQAFAEVASDLVDRRSSIWLHDYHLLALGRALRGRGHLGPIGLFLHVPFPGPDLFEMLPQAPQLLDAMLELDLVGFHTARYAMNFRLCAQTMLGAKAGDEVVEHRGRRTQVGVFPIGIMPETFSATADPAAEQEAGALMEAIRPAQLVLGVDRLDYTKGIVERLVAFGRMLERYPEHRGKVCLVQVSVPSRADVTEYAEQRREIENVVGRINGEVGEATWVPIRYLYRSFTREQLASLYRAADVGYVTPLRDGMNLVAKEYVAAQDPERPGALLLSRFAGAAAELQDALLTNPYDADGMAEDLHRALGLPLEERRRRHRLLLHAVERSTALTWGEDFLERLGRCQ
jgi:trehalose 6-phosphate synthase